MVFEREQLNELIVTHSDKNWLQLSPENAPSVDAAWIWYVACVGSKN